MGKVEEKIQPGDGQSSSPPPDRESEAGFARTSTTLKVVQTKNAGKSSSWQLTPPPKKASRFSTGLEREIRRDALLGR